MRQKVLRPRQAPEELEYPGDDAPDSRHVGAYLAGELVGVASVCREPQPGGSEPRAWRLRGMATLPSVRRTGVGQTLLEACSAHAAERGGARLWCNARSAAVEFYRALGFRIEGEEFELPEIGAHFLMWRPIPRFELRQATEGDSRAGSDPR
ncbi:MAG: GNAT family N-acetyltransferase [Myxococcota bacterium]